MLAGIVHELDPPELLEELTVGAKTGRRAVIAQVSKGVEGHADDRIRVGRLQRRALLITVQPGVAARLSVRRQCGLPHDLGGVQVFDSLDVIVQVGKGVGVLILGAGCASIVEALQAHSAVRPCTEPHQGDMGAVMDVASCAATPVEGRQIGIGGNDGHR